MNAYELDIESLLRLAPRPAPPVNLKDRLLAQIRLPANRSTARLAATTRPAGGWLRRWWPVIAPAAISLAAGVMLTAQQIKIHALKESVQTLSQAHAATSNTQGVPDDATGKGSSTQWQAEITRLRQESDRLTAEIMQLQQMRAENRKLRDQLATPANGALSPADAGALANASEKSDELQCVNNLKQLGLAIRMWGLDNDDAFPPDIQSMSNEIVALKLLICPADTSRHAATDWATLSLAGCSYEFLGNFGKQNEPTRVTFRCPIHGNILLGDGSVQRGSARNHPEYFFQRDGKTYFEPDGASSGATPSSQPGGSTPDVLKLNRGRANIPMQEILRYMARPEDSTTNPPNQ